MKRSAFFISDGTGITADTLGQSLLAQFETINFTKLTRPYIDSVEKARAIVQQINAAAEKDGARPIIFDTIVNQEIREVLAESDGFMIDIFSSFLAPLEQELSSHSSYSVGKSHSIGIRARRCGPLPPPARTRGRPSPRWRNSRESRTEQDMRSSRHSSTPARGSPEASIMPP